MKRKALRHFARQAAAMPEKQKQTRNSKGGKVIWRDVNSGHVSGFKGQPGKGEPEPYQPVSATFVTGGAPGLGKRK
jgi:hypothetical protein